MSGAPDVTPSISAPFYRYLNLLNIMQKGKKSKKGFPHLGIELKTSRTEILAPIKTEQTFYVVMPRSTCFRSEASWFILTGSPVTFEISTSLHHLELFLANCVVLYVTLALLSQQQSVNQAGPPLADYKKNIESNFKSLKAGLAPKDKESVPKLPQNQKEW